MTEMPLLKQKRKENAMKLDFIKMHGCGNDYIYIDCFKNDVEEPEKLAQILSDRHFSVGGDGVILVCPSDIADARMRMFNADGSEGKMCGNGVRCVAKFVYDNGLCRNDPMRIETLSGVKTIALTVENDEVIAATVDMGTPILRPSMIPVVTGDDLPIIGKKIAFPFGEYEISCVSMGNPHCVVFVQQDFDLWGFDIAALGPKFENAPMFPDRVNTEFVKVHDETRLEMRVWERGSGETLACGTGACATGVAACENGFCKKNTDVYVKLKGGELKIRYTGNTVLMTGNAVEAFRGTVEI